MIKELAEEFKNQFTCLGENTEKYITFITFPNREVTRTYKIGEQVIKNIPYILQFTDGAGFMVRWLTNLVINLSEGINKIKFKNRHDDKKCETCRIQINTNIIQVFML